jgi:hypothetical protein
MRIFRSEIRFAGVYLRNLSKGIIVALFCLLLYHNPASAQNYALNLDGNGDYVGFSTIPTYNSTMTIEAWIKIVIPSGYAIAEPNIVSWGASANSVEFRLGISGSTATLQFGIDATGSGGGAWQAIYGSTNINSGNWVHVAVVKNGTTSTLYINGVSEVSGTIDRTLTLNTFDIGNLNEHGGQQNRYFPGLIDEVRIWSTARTQSELQSSMHKELAGNESGLAHYYKMLTGTGTTLTDNVSSGGVNGTLYGNTVWTQPDAFPVQLFISDVYTASYATVKGAFDAINDGTRTGAIKLKLTGSTYEIATATLYQNGYTGAGGPSNYSSVSLFPTVTGLSIAGSLAAPLIDLNGADNVTIDGRVNASGSAKDLIISNSGTSSIAGTSTIRLINDASTNTVKYCSIKGSSNDAAAGIIFFSVTAGSTGNDDNLIDNNNVTNSTDANRPVNAIYSLGTAEKENSGNTISNNNIYDFLSRGINSYGIILLGYTTDCDISGNSFYETNSFVPTTGATSHYLISIENTTGTGFTISNNYMGGSSPDCGTGGSVASWTKTAAQNNFFYGINLNVGTGTVTSIQGNTMKNFSYSSSGFCAWTGIFSLGGGDLNIGTITGNTIGESTGNGSITFTAGSAGSNFYGFYIQNAGTVNIQNNAIGSIQASNASSANSTNFIGIYKSNSGITTISNNTIGSTTTTNSIYTNSTSTENAQSVYGINSAGTGTVTISGNTISKLTNGTTNTSSTTTGLVQGIITTNGTNAINNNTVRDLTIANTNTRSDVSTSVIGISQISTTAEAQSVTGNTIYNLSNTYGSFAGFIYGLYYQGPATASTVSGNFIHSLTVTSNSYARIIGMNNKDGTTTVSNNIISLGGNTTSGFWGIVDRSGTNSYYFNTVYIGGTPTTGSDPGYSMMCWGPNTKNIRNNLFINARSNSGDATGGHYCMYLDNLTGLTIDYNDYFASGTGGYLGYYGGSKNYLPFDTGQDLHSVNTNPAFASAGGTTAANYVTNATLPGVTDTGITTDFVGTARSATPKMGAYEPSVQAPTITSFTPTTAGTGATVTIAGTNLTAASIVTLGGTAPSSFNVVSATSITAVVASGTTGSMSVTTPGGSATLTGFTYCVNNTITLTSAVGTNAQTLCKNTAITNITYATTGATGATFSGLPTGVSGAWSGNVVTISGKPTVADSFSYTVTLTGGCGNITAPGSITVTTTSISITSSDPDNLISSGTAVIFTSTVQNGGSNPTYQWYKNGTAIPDATSSTYSTSSLINNDAIRVDFSSSCTCASAGDIVTSNLVLNLDALNVSSYPGTGTTWYDLSDNNNDVTMQNSGNITWNSGGYFTLTSSGYFNKATTTNLPSGNGSYNLSVWVKLPSTWGNQGFISIGNFGSSYQFNGFRTNGTNGYNHSWWGSDLAPGNGTLSPATSWFNAVAQFDGTTRSIWINGVQLDKDTPGSNHNVTSSLLQIGNASNEYLNGDIGQALIYSRALTSTEIIQNYDAEKARFLNNGNVPLSSNSISTAIATEAIALTSASGTDAQSLCKNTAITNITYATTGASGATFSGLPTGVGGSWSANVVTISGTPSVAGSYSYTVTLTGVSGNITATGTITVAASVGGTVKW